MNDALLEGTGTVRNAPVGEDPEVGGLFAEWRLAWPRQERDQNRFEHRALDPVVVRAVFPPGWAHGHLAGSRLGSWPLQIVDETDASRHAGIVRAIVEAEVHQVIYEASSHWRVIPAAEHHEIS